jgi:hypothetical protein
LDRMGRGMTDSEGVCGMHGVIAREPRFVENGDRMELERGPTRRRSRVAQMVDSGGGRRSCEGSLEILFRPFSCYRHNIVASHIPTSNPFSHSSPSYTVFTLLFTSFRAVTNIIQNGPLCVVLEKGDADN